MGGGGGNTTIQAPPAPNYQESMRDILKAQVEMAPAVYQSESQYQPLYNALQAAQQAFQVQQGLNIAKQSYPQIAEMEADYNAANRRAELGQLQTALPEYQRAFNALTPGYAEAVASTGQLAQSAMAQSLNRPQFSSFQNAVRDPYGRPIGPQSQPSQFAPQQLSLQPQPQLPPRYQAPFSQTPQQLQQAQVAPKIQYDQGLEDRFKQFAADMQGKLPGMTAAPRDPGGVIAPVYQRIGRGNATRLTNQAAIDTRNAEIAKYQADLAVFKGEEAKRQAGAGAYLSNFDPAAAFAPQQATAPQQQPATSLQQQVAQQAANSNLFGVNGAPITPVGGPGISVGQMQGPALPPGFQAQAPAAPQAQGGGKGTPPAPQGQAGNYSDQMRGQLQGQMGMAPQTQDQVLARQGGAIPAGQQAAYQQAFSQNQQAQAQSGQAQPAKGGKGVPPAPQGPGGNFSGQMQQTFSPLEQTPAGGYVGAVKDFTVGQGTGRSADMLLSQTQRDLAAGRRLTAEEQRMADQSVRSAYAARGTALGNQAVGAEILNRADVANQRYQQRLQNASQAAQVGMSQQELLQSAQAQRYQQAMGREELSAVTQQNAFNQALARNQAEQQLYSAGTQAQAAQAALGTGAMSQLQAAQAPILQAFYKQPILQGQEAQAQQMAMAMQQQAGPQYFNPESATGMGSIYGAYNSQVNLAGAQAQANAAKSAGKSSMMGALGGAAIGGAALIF